MSELNREQIIKAMECCIDGGCSPCHYRQATGASCSDVMLEDALALIKELTKENEKARKENELLHSTRERHFTRAQRNVIEAVQERFTMRYGTYTDGDMTPIKEVFSLLDKFEKEMLEDGI